MTILNIILSPFRLIKWFIYDSWDDIIFIKDVVTGKRKLIKQELRDEFNRTNTGTLVKDVLKLYWWCYVLMIACVLLGIFLSGKHYQDKCNVFIYDNYVSDEDKGLGYDYSELPFGDLNTIDESYTFGFNESTESLKNP